MFASFSFNKNFHIPSVAVGALCSRASSEFIKTFGFLGTVRIIFLKNLESNSPCILLHPIYSTLCLFLGISALICHSADCSNADPPSEKYLEYVRERRVGK
jgi:hypothetical protein